MIGSWKASLGVLLVFILGGASGILGTSVYFNHRTTTFFQKGSAAYVELLEYRMTRNLNLDATQKAAVHQILLDDLDTRKLLQAQIQPQLRLLNHQTSSKIAAILRPDQLALFRQNNRHPGRNSPNNNSSNDAPPPNPPPPAIF